MLPPYPVAVRILLKSHSACLHAGTSRHGNAEVRISVDLMYSHWLNRGKPHAQEPRRVTIRGTSLKARCLSRRMLSIDLLIERMRWHYRGFGVGSCSLTSLHSENVSGQSCQQRSLWACRSHGEPSEFGGAMPQATGNANPSGSFEFAQARTSQLDARLRLWARSSGRMAADRPSPQVRGDGRLSTRSSTFDRCARRSRSRCSTAVLHEWPPPCRRPPCP